MHMYRSPGLPWFHVLYQEVGLGNSERVVSEGESRRTPDQAKHGWRPQPWPTGLKNANHRSPEPAPPGMTTSEMLN